NAGFGTWPASKTLVRPFALPLGANTACAPLYDATSATAAVRSGLPTRDAKNAASTSDSSIALSMKPLSLQPVCMYAIFLPRRPCISPPTDEYCAQPRVVPPPTCALASSFQPELVA